MRWVWGLPYLGTPVIGMPERVQSFVGRVAPGALPGVWAAAGHQKGLWSEKRREEKRQASAVGKKKRREDGFADSRIDGVAPGASPGV